MSAILAKSRENEFSGLRKSWGVSPKHTNSSADVMIGAKKHTNTSITQFFFTGNMIHDIYYRYVGPTPSSSRWLS